jgi:hypothetical protein
MECGKDWQQIKNKDHGKAGEAEDFLFTDLYKMVMMLEEIIEMEIEEEWKQWN